MDNRCTFTARVQNAEMRGLVHGSFLFGIRGWRRWFCDADDYRKVRDGLDRCVGNISDEIFADLCGLSIGGMLFIVSSRMLCGGW